MVKKVKQKMTSHANEMFLERTGQSNTQSPHFNEIKANCDYTHSQYLSTEKELHRQEAECRSLFGGDVSSSKKIFLKKNFFCAGCGDILYDLENLSFFFVKKIFLSHAFRISLCISGVCLRSEQRWISR